MKSLKEKSQTDILWEGGEEVLSPVKIKEILSKKGIKMAIEICDGNGFGFSLVAVDGEVNGASHQNQDGRGVWGCDCKHPNCTGYTSSLSPDAVEIIRDLQARMDKGASLAQAVEGYWVEVQKEING